MQKNFNIKLKTILLLAAVFAFLPTLASAATRTISNAGGNWSSPSAWVGGLVPTASNDVVATPTSGNLTINVDAFARTIDLTGYTGTITHNAGKTLSIGDSANGFLKFVPEMNYVVGDPQTSIISFNSTAFQSNITTADKVLGSVIFNGSDGSWILQDSLTVSGNLTISAGELDTSTNSITVAGDWTDSTDTFEAQSNTVTLTGTGNHTITTSGNSFYNLAINGSGGTYVLQDALTINNDLTITAGTLDASTSNCASVSCDITVNGNWSNADTFLARTGTVILAGTSNQTLASGGSSFYNVTLNGGGTYVLQDALGITNNLTLTASTFLDVSASNCAGVSCDITIAGNWIDYGTTFQSQTGTVTLTGTNQSIIGYTTFYNLTKTVSSPDTLTFQAGTGQTIAAGGILTLQGASGNLLSLRSDSSPDQWGIEVSGNSSVNYIDVMDSFADGDNAIAAPNSVNSGNNVNWNFAPAFSADPSDGGSSQTTPTSVGANVTFTATATDSNLDTYYLAICKTNSITANNGFLPPTCNDDSWCVSDPTNPGDEATCSYAASSSDQGTNAWYAFVCDNSGASLCSPSGQGANDDTGSPFVVTNSAPIFTADPSDGSSSSSTPTFAGNNVTFTATATDPQSNNYFLAICRTDYITPHANSAPTCDDGQTWAISGSTASGQEASTTYTTQQGDGTQDWFAFVCDDNANSACSTSSQGAGDDTGTPFVVQDIQPPTVTTESSDNVTNISADVHGTIQATGGNDADKRGFVYGTTSFPDDPGNVPPDSSGYDTFVEDSNGPFSTGPFTNSLTSLTQNTTYYVRAYAHNSQGYSYGDEVNFTPVSGNLTINDSSTTCVGSPNWTTNGADCTVNVTDIEDQLNAGTSVSFNATNIIISSGFSKISAGDVTVAFYADDNILNTTTNVDISSTSGKMNILFNADKDGDGSGGISIVSALTSNGGDIIMGGGSGTISAGVGYAIGTNATNSGIYIGGDVNSGDGAIIMNGKGNASTANAEGVHVATGLISSASGNITIFGIGGGGSASDSGSEFGVYVVKRISSIDGSVAITGTGGGSGAGTGNFAVAFSGIANLVATSGGGNISITGIRGVGNNNTGVSLVTAAGNTIQTTGTGNIFITTDTIDFNGFTNPVISSAGSLTVTPYTQNTTVGIGGASGTLNIPNTNVLVSSDLTFGNSSDTGVMTLSSRAWAQPTHFVVGDFGNIIVNGLQVTENGFFSFTGPTTLNNNLLNVATDGQILFSGPVTVGNAVTINSGAGNITFSNAIDGTGRLTLISSSTINFDGTIGSSVPPSIIINGTSTGSTVFSAPNTFADLTINAANSIIFPSSLTQIITGEFTCAGSSGNIITIHSSINGVQHTLSKSSGTVTCDYLDLQDSNATGGATWYAGPNSITNPDNNTGWIFTAAPPAVTTQAADNITISSADIHGTITGTGNEDEDKRGFVYGTTSQSDPGNTAPASSGYDTFWEDSAGPFSTGSFSTSLTDLTSSATYYVRAYAHNSIGYSYGAEVHFTISGASYWVGGSGNWSDATNHWAASSGGVPESNNLPAPITNVHFDNRSSLAWQETQPAGDTSQSWFSSASSSDGSHLIAGVGGDGIGRLYISTDAGQTWNEARPAGDTDKSWHAVASSADGSRLIAGVGGGRFSGGGAGRLYLSSNSGQSWTETRPAGNVNKQWFTVASDSTGQYLIAGVGGGNQSGGAI